MKVLISILDVKNTMQKNGNGIHFTLDFAIGLQLRFYKRFGNSEVYFCDGKLNPVELTPYKWEGCEIHRM